MTTVPPSVTPELVTRQLPRGNGATAGAFFALGIVVVVLLAGVHLTQGTSATGLGDLLRYFTGRAGDRTAEIGAVLSGSRLPRLVTGMIIGVVLGVAGVAMQSLARNPLASPDTLAVNAGAYLAVSVVAAFGIALPTLLNGGVAFIGGVAAAALVVLLGGTGSTTRLVLAGTALSIALASVTSALQLLFREETTGLFVWGDGSLLLIDLDGVRSLLPVLAVVVLGLMLTAHKMDLLALGDDTAASLGVNVGRLRLLVLVMAVLLATCAVTLAGPIGFVGLFAPACARLLSRRVLALVRHRLLYPAAGLIGAAMVIAADVLLRAVFGSRAGVNVPTGIVTTIVGATLLIALARRASASRAATSSRAVATASTTRFRLVLVGAVLLAVIAIVSGIIVGPRILLLGDVSNWLLGRAGRIVNGTMNERLPRVLGAFMAGAALAVAGSTVQAVCRNPLAEPGLLGVTAGAGCGAVLTITVFPEIGVWGLTAVATVGALLAFAIVYLLARRRGLDSGRIVLVGIGVFAGGTALISMMVILTDPWNKIKAITWLSGSTYGRTVAQLVPVLIALIVLVPLILLRSRQLDLLALDDDTPRTLGVPLERSRLLHLAGAAVLTAASVSAIGVIAFVGLVAPHLARALVGSGNSRSIPVALLFGGLLVCTGDILGRNVIAPAQLPAGLLAAIIGAPYFIYLLFRTRD